RLRVDCGGWRKTTLLFQRRFISGLRLVRSSPLAAGFACSVASGASSRLAPPPPRRVSLFFAGAVVKPHEPPAPPIRGDERTGVRRGGGGPRARCGANAGHGRWR